MSLLGTGIALFVIPRASTVSLAAGYGALFGARGLRRLRLHQLLDAAPVAVRVDAGRRGVGSGGVGRVRGGRRIVVR